MWPAITGLYLPFSIFGETDIEEMSGFIAVAFPIVYCLVTWLLCLVLFMIVMPDHNEYVRGIRRARKAGLQALPAWADDAAGPGFMALYIAVVLAGFGVIYGSLIVADLFDFMAEPGSGLWRLPLALALVLGYSLLLLQTLERRPTLLAMLLVWCVPILVAIVLSAITQAVETPHAVIASLSPVALLIMAGGAPLADVVPANLSGEFGTLQTALTTGFAFLTLQIALLGLRWRRCEAALRARCGPASAGANEPPDR